MSELEDHQYINLKPRNEARQPTCSSGSGWLDSVRTLFDTQRAGCQSLPSSEQVNWSHRPPPHPETWDVKAGVTAGPGVRCASERGRGGEGQWYRQNVGAVIEGRASRVQAQLSEGLCLLVHGKTWASLDTVRPLLNHLKQRLQNLMS